jgi:hypothetical protein
MTRLKVTLLLVSALVIQPFQLQAENGPAFKWVSGKITQMLVQPKENYYTFFVRDDEGGMTLVRLCDPNTGAAAPVTTVDPTYDLLRESFFRGSPVEVGFRAFGYDSQSGTPRNCVDRVSLVNG